MRRTIVALTIILSIVLAACSPYDTPAAGQAGSPQLSAPTAPLARVDVDFDGASVRASVPCDRACWERIVARQHAERAWWAEVVANQRRTAAWNRLLAHLEAQRRTEAARHTGGAYVQGIEVCNGRTLPTCAIVRRESRFDPNARNPTSSAWGLFQFLRGTWRAVCPEFPHGRASVAQQVECARRLWAGGRGAGHWRLTA